MFDRACFYLTFGGYQIGSKEIWQSGLHFAPEVPQPVGTLIAQLDQISVQDCLTAAHTLIKTNNANLSWHTSQSVDWAKLSVLGTNGELAAAPKVAQGHQSGMLGTAFAPVPQLSLAVSLWSGETFGPANHGRMYLPPTGQMGGVDPLTGTMTTAQVDAYRAAVVAFINSLDGEISTVQLDVTPFIMGTVTISKEIKKVGVGRVVDTQRKRRNHLDDTVATWTDIG